VTHHLLFFSLFLFHCSISFAQSPNPEKKKPAEVMVRLQWKSPYKSAIAFDTKLIPLQVKADGILLQQDMATLIEAATAPITSIVEGGPRWLEKIGEPWDRKVVLETYAVLGPSPAHKGSLRAHFTTMVPTTLGGKRKLSTILMGRINEQGINQSFYVPQKEKNVLSVFFQLPKKSIKIRDSWSIPFHFVSIPGKIECTKSLQQNRVTLKAIETTKSKETIALLDYRIVEHVEGDLPGPDGHGHSHKIALTMVFFGQAEFHIERGTWLKFRGRMRIKQSGEWKSDYEQIYSLDLLERMPKFLSRKP
jgi:hypothetical protein